MTIDGWDEIRTAYAVARAGTVSGAAQSLGVHHATVIRHVDALEARLGVKLFQRHSRGYVPTEAGADLFRVAAATDDQFSQLAARLVGAGGAIEGELTVTALEFLSRPLTATLAELGAAHPRLVIRCLTDPRLFRLEYGEAHVAIRAGAAPEEADNVVQPLGVAEATLHAAPAYLAARGTPDPDGDMAGHVFVGPDDAAQRAPFHRWLHARVPRSAVAFRTADEGVSLDAVAAGAGLGFATRLEAAGRDDVVEAVPPRADWSVQLWLVTHVDLHRSAKVQAAVAHLKRAAAGWPGFQAGRYL